MPGVARPKQLLSVRIRQHASAYVSIVSISIRQHTSCRAIWRNHGMPGVARPKQLLSHQLPSRQRSIKVLIYLTSGTKVSNFKVLSCQHSTPKSACSFFFLPQDFLVDY
jgi:hypothetical protein